MVKVAAFALCLVYFAFVLAGVPLAGPRIAPWFLAVLSAAFVWCYLVLTRGRISVALAVVIVVTLVLPLGALIVIAWPVYQSWAGMGASFWAAFEERGPFGGVEFLAPTIAAALCASVVRRWRSNIAVNPDAPSARRLP
jgi:phosphotransferase system  glucose/maltose/N-acetylglucosamine-specific IIC component